MVLVDISNPRNPVIVDFRPLPIIGAHSMRANEANGMTIITASVDNAVSTASYYAFFQIMPTAAGPRLIPLSIYNYVPPTPDKAEPTAGVHMDGLVAVHPITH